LLLAMTVVVATNVCYRFVLNDPLSWGDEVAQILLVWLTFLGAALAVRDDEHYYLNYLSRKASGPALRRLQLFRDLATLLAIGVLLYYSAIVSWQIRQWIMPATEISRALVYGACPVGCAFMLFYGLDRFRRHLQGDGIEMPAPTPAPSSDGAEGEAPP
jgi:TRAP-type C4-dicarboxylate transport system permease small subunit